MSPVFFDGDIAIVDTTRRPAEGDFILLDLGPKDRGQLEPGRSGPYVIRRLLKRTAAELVCEMLEPERKRVTFPLSQIAGFWRVMHPKER
jgi:phage repressor protein C with HTH and peptisase S24 domain